MRILFQGDSVTDAGRAYEDGADLGQGYARLVADWAERHFPGTECLNRGVSGHRSQDLVERWQRDTLRLKPDVVTLLVGINDVWRKFDADSPTSDEAYEANLRSLMSSCRAAGMKIVLIQPFLFRHGVVTEAWEAEFNGKRAVADRLALAYAHAYLPMGDIFDCLTLEHDAKRYSTDGVHPIAEGCAVIAGELEKTLYPFLIGRR